MTGAERKTLIRFYASRTLGSPENAVGFVLWKLVHRFQRTIDRELLALDLTHLQFTVLAMVGWLNRGQEATTQAQLSRYADIHVMQISQLLTMLEAKGMILRTSSPTNSRAKCVEITSSGLQALRDAMPIAIRVQRRLFGKAGAPGGELLVALQEAYGKSTGLDEDVTPIADRSSKTHTRRARPLDSP